MEGLHERMATAARGRTYRALGALTGIHPETVRRYMQGQAPSVEFLAAMCNALDINAQWLISGEGPMRAQDIRRTALRDADAGELLTAVARAIESLTERLHRVELYVQTLETRVRAGMIEPEGDGLPSRRAGGGRGKGGGGGGGGGGSASKRRTKGDHDGESTARAARIADAIPERSRSDAD